MTCTVEAVIMPGVYLVKDQLGRQSRAHSVEVYRRNDQVAVIDGQIVGRAATPAVVRIYEV